MISQLLPRNRRSDRIISKNEQGSGLQPFTTEAISFTLNHFMAFIRNQVNADFLKLIFEDMISNLAQVSLEGWLNF